MELELRYKINNKDENQVRKFIQYLLDSPEVISKVEQTINLISKSDIIGSDEIDIQANKDVKWNIKISRNGMNNGAKLHSTIGANNGANNDSKTFGKLVRTGKIEFPLKRMFYTDDQIKQMFNNLKNISSLKDRITFIDRNQLNLKNILKKIRRLT